MHSFEVRHRVAFSDTDMAGIVHFSNYFKYMEMVEHAFFRALGYSIVGGVDQYDVNWPRVHADFDYKAPLFFEDEMLIRLNVLEKRTKTLKYRITVEKIKADETTQTVAVGHLVVCCTVSLPEGGMRGTQIPPEFAAKIHVTPAELL